MNTDDNMTINNNFDFEFEDISMLQPVSRSVEEFENEPIPEVEAPKPKRGRKPIPISEEAKALAIQLRSYGLSYEKIKAEIIKKGEDITTYRVKKIIHLNKQ